MQSVRGSMNDDRAVWCYAVRCYAAVLCCAVQVDIKNRQGLAALPGPPHSYRAGDCAIATRWLRDTEGDKGGAAGRFAGFVLLAYLRLQLSHSTSCGAQLWGRSPGALNAAFAWVGACASHITAQRRIAEAWRSCTRPASVALPPCAAEWQARQRALESMVPNVLKDSRVPPMLVLKEGAQVGCSSQWHLEGAEL